MDFFLCMYSELRATKEECFHATWNSLYTKSVSCHHFRGLYIKSCCFQSLEKMDWCTTLCKWFETSHQLDPNIHEKCIQSPVLKSHMRKAPTQEALNSYPLQFQKAISWLHKGLVENESSLLKLSPKSVFIVNQPTYQAHWCNDQHCKLVWSRLKVNFAGQE